MESLADIAGSGGHMAVANTSKQLLYVTLVQHGSPAPGDEEVSLSGWDVRIRFSTRDDRSMELAFLEQGADVTATVSIRNDTDRPVHARALMAMAPSRWEIQDEGPQVKAFAGCRGYRECQDVNDERVHSCFSLPAGDSLTIPVQFHPAYVGRYYLLSVRVEAMYDGAAQASVPGVWTTVTPRKD